MKILITGAAGLVGSHFATRLSHDHEVAVLKHRDLDIRDAARVRMCVEQLAPELIVNCAVLQVDECEQDPARARGVNIDGPRQLAQAARDFGATIVHFSTQYAFEGEPRGRAPYTIQDEPRPVSVYGRTKVEGETAVRETCPRSYVIRTSWVFGGGKNSFLCTVAGDLGAGRHVRAIDDIWSSATYVEDLIDRAVMICSTERFGIYHVVNGGVCSYYEFALEAGRLRGLGRYEIDRLVEVVHECDLRRPAPRPRYTPLRCLLSEELGLPPMRHWKDALAEYVRS